MLVLLGLGVNFSSEKKGEFCLISPKTLVGSNPFRGDINESFMQ